MKKRLLLSLCVLIAQGVVYCQDSPLQKDNRSDLFSPVQPIVIKAEDFRRFPTGNFMDAVNTLSPWVFSQTPDANNYLFVVNGFLLADINAISLNDIEEVRFSRSPNAGLYPFSKAGTFYITTHKFSGGKTAVNFNTQYNLISQKDNASTTNPVNLVYNSSTKNKWGHMTGNNLSVMTGGTKWGLFVSAQLNQTALPKSVVTTTEYQNSTGNRTDSLIITGSQKQLNLVSFLQFTCQFSSKLQAGISGSYFHGTTNSDSSASEFVYPDNNANAKITARATLPYYHSGAYIHWTPLSQLSNRISFEYAADNLHDHGNAESNYFSPNNPVHTRNSTGDIKAYSKRWLIKDDLKYSFHTFSKFQSGVDVLFSYVFQKVEYQNDQFNFDNYGGTSQSASQSTFRFSGDQKIASLNPQFYFSYNQQISGYAGYAWLLNNVFPTSSLYTVKAKSNPYGGIVFNFKNMIKANKLNRLDASVEYGDLTQNNSNNNWLPGIKNADQFSPSPVINAFNHYDGSATPPVNNLTILKNKLFTAQANISLLADRFLAGIQWSSLQSQSLYGYFFNNLLVPVEITETHQGYSAYVAAKLVNKPLFTWTIRFNVLMMPAPHYKTSFDAPGFTLSPQDQLQTGIQNNISFKNWFAQVHGSMALNNKTVNMYSLNYFLIGYHFSGAAGSVMQRMSVFLQARNLLSNNAAKNFYGYYTYSGAGINLTL